MKTLIKKISILAGLWLLIPAYVSSMQEKVDKLENMRHEYFTTTLYKEISDLETKLLAKTNESEKQKIEALLSAKKSALFQMRYEIERLQEDIVRDYLSETLEDQSRILLKNATDIFNVTLRFVDVSAGKEIGTVEILHDFRSSIMLEHATQGNNQVQVLSRKKEAIATLPNNVAIRVEKKFYKFPKDGSGLTCLQQQDPEFVDWMPLFTLSSEDVKNLASISIISLQEIKLNYKQAMPDKKITVPFDLLTGKMESSLWPFA